MKEVYRALSDPDAQSHASMADEGGNALLDDFCPSESRDYEKNPSGNRGFQVESCPMDWRFALLSLEKMRSRFAWQFCIFV